MYQIKNSCWPTITTRESSLGVLSQSAPPANITLLCAELWQTCNHISQQPESWMMQVSHPPMPQLTKLVAAAYVVRHAKAEIRACTVSYI